MSQNTDLSLARDAMRWVTDQRLTTAIIDEDNFNRFASGAHTIGLPLPERVRFCLSQWCNKIDLEQRLQEIDGDLNDQGRQFFAMFEELGWRNPTKTDELLPRGSVVSTNDIWRRIKDQAGGYGWITEYDAKRAVGIRGNDKHSRRKNYIYEQAIAEGVVLRERKTLGKGYKIRAVGTNKI